MIRRTSCQQAVDLVSLTVPAGEATTTRRSHSSKNSRRRAGGRHEHFESTVKEPLKRAGIFLDIIDPLLEKRTGRLITFAPHLGILIGDPAEPEVLGRLDEMEPSWISYLTHCAHKGVSSHATANKPRACALRYASTRSSAILSLLPRLGPGEK